MDTLNTFDIKKQGFPKDDISPSQKGKEWILQAAKAAFYDYSNSSLLDHQAKIPLFRQYAKGRQPKDPYISRMGIKNKDAAHVNLNWEPLKLGVKYTELAVGMLSKYKLTPNCTSVDPMSIDMKIQHEYFIRSMDFMRQNSHSQVLQKMGKGLPSGDYEIRRYMESDYKQAIEMDMEAGIDMVLLQNQFDEIEKGVKRDLAITGMGGTKTYIDSSGMVKMRKVDPAMLVIPPSALPNLEDARYKGEMTFLTVADLRMLDIYNDISKGEWDVIIKNHTGTMGGMMNGYRSSGSGIYDEFDSKRVKVFEFEYMTYDQTVHEKKETKYGTSTMNRRDVDYSPSKNSKYKRERVSSRYKCWYKGVWIIGTDFILDYGKCTNQVRGNVSEGKLADAKSSYSIYITGLDQGDTRPVSLVERMIPHIDDIQLTWMKIQNLKAKTRPKGIMFDVDQIAAVAASLGMNPNDALGVIGWFDATGNIAYSSAANADLLDGKSYLNQQKPIEELENGLPRDFQVLVNDLFTGIRMIQEVTGINEAVDASNVAADRPVKTSQMAAMAAGTAMWTILDAYKNIFLNTCNCVAKKLQQVVYTKGPISGYIRALGEGKIMSFKSSKEIAFAEFSLIIKELPNEEEISMLQSWIVEALRVRTSSGRGGLDIGTAMKAMRLSRHNVRAAEMFLIQSIEKQQEIDRQQELENIRLNAESQQASAAQAQQGRDRELAMNQEGKMSIQEQQNRGKMEQLYLQKGLEGINQIYGNKSQQQQ